MSSDQMNGFNQARRSFMLNAGVGLGALSLAELLGVDLYAQAAASAQASAPGLTAPGTAPGVLPAPHHTPRAKQVICLHMLGAISQADTFDYKPTLEKMHGEELPASVRNTQRLSTMSNGQSSFPIVGPIAKFQQRGQSGAWVSDLLPYIAGIADDLCFIKTVYTEHVNHDPAAKFLHTGFQLSGRPSVGAWVNYGLGSDNTNLPAFIVMSSGVNQGVPLDSNVWGSGFLPSHYQGVQFRAEDSPVLYVNNPKGVEQRDRREWLDALTKLAATQHVTSQDPEILSRMSQYEMAYRMQTSVPEVADISNEPQHVLDMYGPDVHKPGTFARNCLIARRLAERGVKYQTLFGMGFDHHFAINTNLPLRCKDVDQGAAALVKDLKERGLLEDTLVIFGSEFGRTSFAQGQLKTNFGRDHHGGCFTWWLAGGGVKAGYTHGETDDFSYNIAKDPVHIHDLNATILQILGVDHTKLTYRFQGRDFRLTDVHGNVVKQVLT